MGTLYGICAALVVALFVYLLWALWRAEDL
ncbi:K(+)-transporting ATPase subunit F [Methyloversatilis discipulorum]|nr:K(+)-transporting ATPase subunit F [Methyloversatilis discipulorum]MBL8469779.1 K(+)-transporting ATPase subunit F [Methyloversatilis discipulorum]